MMAAIIWWLSVIVAGIVLVTMGVVFRGAPYLPTRRTDIKRAFDELYKIGPDDVLVDIGSGDGVVLREAVRRGARAIGVEINPFLVLSSRWASRKYPQVAVLWRDMWRYQISPEATVVYVFGTSRDVPRIAAWVEQQVAEHQQALVVISYGFKLPWAAVRSVGAHHMYQVSPLQKSEA